MKRSTRVMGMAVTTTRTDLLVGEGMCYAAALVSIGALGPALVSRAPDAHAALLDVVLSLALGAAMSALGLATRRLR